MDPAMPKYRLIFAALMIGFECWKISAWKITDGINQSQVNIVNQKKLFIHT